MGFNSAFKGLIKKLKIKDGRGVVRGYYDSPSHNEQDANYSVIMSLLTESNKLARLSKEFRIMNNSS